MSRGGGGGGVGEATLNLMVLLSDRVKSFLEELPLSRSGFSL